MTRQFPLLATLLLLAPLAAAGVLSGPVTGPADLDLSGTIYCAVNLGGTSDALVAGKWFESDNDGDGAPVGYSVVGPNVYLSNWGYGSITDPALRHVYDTMRWIAGNPLSVTLDHLPAGEQVQVQLLISEGYWNGNNRRVDIEIEGTTEFVNVDPWTLWGYKQPGLATATATVSPDGILNVRLLPNAGAPDKNPVLDGIIVSTPVPALPGSAVPLTAASVTASAIYNSQFPAAAVVDGSWADAWTGSNNDFWLLPNNRTGYLQFDLAENWMLQGLEIHNTDNRTYHDRGTLAYHLDISPDPTFASAKTIAAGTLQTFAEGWHTRLVDSDEFWRYARLYVDDYSGSASAAGGGLAEVRLYGITPEPTSLSLLALGALALLRRRRRRA